MCQVSPSKAKLAKILKSLRVDGKICKACEAAGCDRHAFLNYRRANPEFEAECQSAIMEGAAARVEELEDKAEDLYGKYPILLIFHTRASARQAGYAHYDDKAAPLSPLDRAASGLSQLVETLKADK